MPWKGKSDVERHNKRCAKYAACRKLWLSVANKYYEKTGDDGQAVIRANVAAKKWLQAHGKYRKNQLRRRNPKKYTQEQKAEVLRLCEKTKLSYAEIARRTGVERTSVRDWCLDAELRFITYYTKEQRQAAIRLCKQKNPVLTYAQIAEMTGVDRESIRKWCRGLNTKRKRGRPRKTSSRMRNPYRRNADTRLRQLERRWRETNSEEDFRRWFNMAKRTHDPAIKDYRCDVPACPQHQAGTTRLIYCHDCPYKHKVCYSCASMLMPRILGQLYDEQQGIKISEERHNYMDQCACRCHQGIPGWSKAEARWVCTDVLARALGDAGEHSLFGYLGPVLGSTNPRGSCASVLNPSEEEYPSADDEGSRCYCLECAHFSCPNAAMEQADAAAEAQYQAAHPEEAHPDLDYSDHPEDDYDDGWEW